MLIYRVVLFLVLFFSFEIFCEDRIFIKDKDNNSVTYFLGKKAYKKKNYIVANYIFNKLIENNYPSSKYSQKSRLYGVLIHLKLKQFTNAREKCRSFLLNKTSFYEKYIDYIYYTNAIALYYYNTEEYIFMINRYKNDITYHYKAIRSLCKISFLKKEKRELINKIQFYIKAHEVYICQYYFNEKAYLSVIKRIGKFNYNPEDFYDRYKNYLLIKSYNELYLSSISANYINILIGKKKYYFNKYKRPSIYK